MRFVLFLWFITLSVYANDDIYKQNTCSEPELLKNALEALKLDPQIRNNDELLFNINYLYGPNFTSLLKIEHPSLNNHAGVIDLKTIHWIIDSFFFSKPNKLRKVFFAPFYENKKEISEIIIDTIVGESFPSIASQPLFMSDKQFEMTRNLFKENNFEEARLNFTDYYSVDDETALKMSRALYHLIFTKGNFVVGTNNIPETVGAISIIGHSGPKSSTISDHEINVHFSKVSEILKESSMSNNASILISTCYSACGALDAYRRTNLSEDELKEAFIKKEIFNHIGDKKESLGFKLAKKLFEIHPTFKGNVIAFNGAISIAPLLVYARDKTNPNLLTQVKKYGVELKTIDGKEIWFDRMEMHQIFSKDNIR